jgi:hypothetical protein
LRAAGVVLRREKGRRGCKRIVGAVTRGLRHQSLLLLLLLLLEVLLTHILFLLLLLLLLVEHLLLPHVLFLLALLLGLLHLHHLKGLRERQHSQKLTLKDVNCGCIGCWFHICCCAKRSGCCCVY